MNKSNEPKATPFSQTFFHGTKSYRSLHPFKIIGEVTIWQGHTTEQIKTMKEGLAKLKEQGIGSLND